MLGFDNRSVVMSGLSDTSRVCKANSCCPVGDLLCVCVCVFQGSPGARGFPGSDGAAGGKVIS